MASSMALYQATADLYIKNQDKKMLLSITKTTTDHHYFFEMTKQISLCFLLSKFMGCLFSFFLFLFIDIFLPFQHLLIYIFLSSLIQLLDASFAYLISTCLFVFQHSSPPYCASLYLLKSDFFCIYAFNSSYIVADFGVESRFRLRVFCASFRLFGLSILSY